MTTYRGDLHLHTALSPCGGDEMTPPLIVAAALTAGLQVIAVTDHNSVRNVAAVQAASVGTGLTVIPGMEVQTREDVHLVCLFDTLEAAEAWQAEVYNSLPPEENREEFFGTQLLLDAEGREIGREKRMLLASTSLGSEEVAQKVAGLGGLCVPAHVDRPSYSLLANLGFVPPEMEVIALELGLLNPVEARKQFPLLDGWPLIASSDAHYINDIGRRATEYELEEVSLAALAQAITRQHFKVVIHEG